MDLELGKTFFDVDKLDTDPFYCVSALHDLRNVVPRCVWSKVLAKRIFEAFCSLNSVCTANRCWKSECMCQAKAIACFTVAWPSGTFLAVLSLFQAPLANLGALVVCHRPHLSQHCPTFRSTVAVARFGRLSRERLVRRARSRASGSTTYLRCLAHRCSHGPQVCRDKGSMHLQLGNVARREVAHTCVVVSSLFSFRSLFNQLRPSAESLQDCCDSGARYFLSFAMCSIPPLSLSNRCVFRLITSRLTYQVLPSLPCNHGSKIDVPP